MSKIKLRPLDDRVVVEPLEAEEMTAGGIVLPDAAQEKPQRGKVIATGPGKLLDSGSRGGALRQSRRRSHLRQVRRLRSRSQRRRIQNPPRVRHPRQSRQLNKYISRKAAKTEQKKVTTETQRTRRAILKNEHLVFLRVLCASVVYSILRDFMRFA